MQSKQIDDELKANTQVHLDHAEIARVLQGVAGASSCQTALDILEKGPRVRGTERNTYTMSDGATGDVYTVVLRAVASGAPRLALKYPEITEKVEQITKGDPPSGSSIVSTLDQMHKAVKDMAQDRVLEWDSEKETLNFNDPYFLYFLRWRSWDELKRTGKIWLPGRAKTSHPPAYIVVCQ